MRKNINKFRKLDTESKIQLVVTSSVVTLLMAVVIEWGKNGFISYF